MFQEPSVSGHFEGFSIAPLPNSWRRFWRSPSSPPKKHQKTSVNIYHNHHSLFSQNPWMKQSQKKLFTTWRPTSHFSWHTNLQRTRNNFLVPLLITFPMRISMGIAQLSASWTLDYTGWSVRRVAILWGDSGTCSSALGRWRKPVQIHASIKSSGKVYPTRAWGSMGVPKRVGVGQGQWGYWTMGAQWGHWKKTMKRALVSVNGSIEKGSKGALVRVNGGIEKGQWNVNGRWSGSMGVLKRVNGMSMGVGQGQWGYWTMGAQWGHWKQWRGHWSGSMEVLKRGQRGRWSGSMGVLKRVNGMSMGVGQGQWGYWKGSTECQWALVRVNVGIEQWGLNGGIENNEEGIGQGQCGIEKGPRGVGEGSGQTGLGLGQTGVWLWVRQGCGRGSDRRLFYRVVSSTLQGYLAGLQALPCRVVRW